MKKINRFLFRKNAFRIFYVLLFLCFSLASNAQTNFASLGGSDSGGTGYKTVSTNSSIVVSNTMTNDGTDMYNPNHSSFSIIAYGVDDFTFEAMTIRAYTNTDVDVSSTVVFKDKNGLTLQTMTLNSTKNLTTSNTQLTDFFDNGTTVPINNVAEIVFNLGTPVQGYTANYNYVNITISFPVSNTAPTAASFSASPIYQNTAYAFATANFSYSDADGDPLDHVRITNVPANGSLWVDSDASGTINGAESAISNGGTISKANLDAGYLKYLNTNGTSSSFTFDVNDGTDYSTSTYTTTLTVTPEPSVSFTTASQSSVNETGTLTVRAQLSGTFNKTVSIPFSINGATTATGSGTDYSITASPLSISAGSTSADITITIATDAIDEANETVIVNMGTPTNATQGSTTSHTATITDDDDAPSVSFTAASQSSTNETGTMTITAQLSAASGKNVTVPFSVNGASTATGSGTDYSISSSPLTINAGSSSANVTITIATDALDENNETVVVNMGTPTNATQGSTTSHTATITDDDDPPSVSFTAASQSSTNETGTMTITAQLSAASGKTVSVPFTVNGASTATGSGTDYSISASPLTISAGASSASVTITIATDNMDEDNETVIVNMGTPLNAIQGTTTTHTATITDDDNAPTVTFSAASQSSTNESGSMSVTAQLSAVSGKTVSVPFTVNGASTATGSGTDYSISSSPLTINAGSSSANITITIATDALDEDNETVIVDMGTPTNASKGVTASHTATITDDDDAPIVTFTSASQSSVNETGSMTITAQLSAVSGKTVSVPFTVNGASTANGSGIDYSISSSPLTINAGSSSANIIITIAADASDEENETVVVNMGTPINATQGATTSHTATITDDDDAPSVSFTAASQSSTNETGTMTITAQLSVASGKNVTVPYTVNGASTATGSGTDYSISASPLTISAGASSASVTITIATDNMDEDNETVVVDMGTPVNATQGTTTKHTATITDDDAAPSVSFTAASQSSTNESGSMTVTAQLSALSSKTITVPFTVNGASTATGSGTDYSISASPLTISAGASSASVTITIATDDMDEDNETVVVDMGTPVNATQGTTTKHTATITDDDAAPSVSFTAASQSSTNETGTMIITAQLSAVSGKTVTVPFTINGTSTATGGGTDYSITSSPLTINAGTSSADITITIATDPSDEENESVVVNMGTPINALQGSTISHTATITDDDDAPTVTFTTASQSSTSENGSLTITVQPSTASGKTITVPYTINGASTASGGGTDYSIPASPLSILPGEVYSEITISIVSDDLDENNETVIVDMGTLVNGVNGLTISHTATITDDDNTPEVTELQSFTINEAATGTIGTITASDLDAGTSFGSWTITTNSNADADGNNAFAINPTSGQLTINDVDDLDRELNETLTIKVTVSDGTNTSSEEDVTININDINDISPIVTIGQSFDVQENTALSEVFGTVLATDSDVTPTTFSNWTIVTNVNPDLDGNNAFAIESGTGKLKVNDTDDLIIGQSHNLGITCSDGLNTSIETIVTINITPSTTELTITGAVAANKTYDGSDNAVISGATLNGVLNGDDVILDNATTGTFSSEDVGTGIGVTTAMTITGADAGNYTLTQPTGLTADINAATLTATGASVSNKTYDNNTDAVVSGATLSGIVSGDVVTLDNATTGTFALEDVGTGIAVTTAMTISGTDAGNYTFTQPTDLTADITAATLTVTGASASNKTYDGTVDAIVSGATLSGIVSDDIVAFGDANTGTFALEDVGTGIAITTAMTLSGTDAGNYTLTQPTGLTADITAATLTVTGAVAENKEYDGNTDAVVSGATLSGIISGDVVTLDNATSGTFALEDIGTGIAVTTAMTISGTDAGNYTFTQPTGLNADITAKVLTVTGAVAENKEYDGNTDAVISGATLNGVVSGDDVILENATTGTFAIAGKGTDIGVTTAMTISGTDVGNYTLTQPTGLSADITGIILTVTDAIIAIKVYDGSIDAVISGATLNGVLSGNDVTLENATTGTFTSANVGTGVAVTTAMTITGTDAGGYTLTQPSLTGDITPAPTTVIGASASNKTYDGTTNAVVSEATLSGIVTGDVVTLDDATTGTFTSKNVGTGIDVTTAMTISGADAGNYTLTQPTGLIADINATVLEITADAQTKEEGQTDPELTYSLTSGSLIAGESLSGNLSRETGETAGTYAILQGSLTAGANYSITFVSADFVITPVTSVNAQSTESINVYPNPTSNMVNIKLEYLNAQMLTITDITGKQIYIQKDIEPVTSIDLSVMNNGVYILSIKTNKQIITSRIIKE